MLFFAPDAFSIISWLKKFQYKDFDIENLKGVVLHVDAKDATAWFIEKSQWSNGEKCIWK